MDQENQSLYADNSPWIIHDASPSISQKLMLLGKPRIVRNGSFIYHQGDDPRELYYVANGKVKISIFGECGTEKILGFQEEGTLFGMSSFFDKAPYRTTAQAVVASKIYGISELKIFQALQEDSAIAHFITKTFARRIRLLIGQIEGLSFLHAKRQVAQVLARGISSHGQLTHRGKKLGIHLTHQEIADLVSLERSTVTKVLNEFRKMGVVEKQKWELIVVDERKLEQIAEGASNDFYDSLSIGNPPATVR